MGSMEERMQVRMRSRHMYVRQMMFHFHHLLYGVRLPLAIFVARFKRGFKSNARSQPPTVVSPPAALGDTKKKEEGMLTADGRE